MGKIDDAMAVIKYFRSEIERLDEETDALVSEAIISHSGMIGLHTYSKALADDELVETMQRVLDTDMLNNSQKVLAIRTIIGNQ